MTAPQKSALLKLLVWWQNTERWITEEKLDDAALFHHLERDEIDLLGACRAMWRKS